MQIDDQKNADIDRERDLGDQIRTPGRSDLPLNRALGLDLNRNGDKTLKEFRAAAEQ